MSKLQELIDHLCPNGVEFKPLGSLTTWDKRFNGVDRKMQLHVISYPYVLANVFDEIEDPSGNVRLLSTGIGGTERWTTEEKAGANLCEGEIVAIPWGGTPNVKYYKGKFVTADNRIATSSDTAVLSNKFLYYWLNNNIDLIAKTYRGAGIQHPSMLDVLSIKVPIPPIAVQEEIVRILDRFADYAAELQAELQARRLQYEYYRNLLLTFNPSAYGCGTDDAQKISVIARGGHSYEIQWKTMGEIFEMRNGYTPSKNKPEFWENGTIPWFRMEDIRENGRILADSIQHITPASIKGKGLFEANTFILATTATIGEHALLIADSLANQQFTNLKVRKSLANLLDTKFIFYYMFIVDEFCKNNTNVSGFASVDMGKLKQMPFPIPPLELQEKIVAILDRFDTLVNDLSKGLPAEIEAVKARYEYYRNKLLTFNPLSA